jgi:ATP-dependent DNA helicase RecG
LILFKEVGYWRITTSRIIANTLIHREYINEYPARLIISKSEVEISNWNRPHGSGRFRLDTYSPFPKNPVIAAFFREIGRAEELGSGFRNSEHYTRLYTNGFVPIFEEGDIFRTIIPVMVRSKLAIDPAIDPAIDDAINGSFNEATPETRYKLSILLKAIINDEGRRKPDYLKSTNIGSESTIKRYLDQLREVGFIEFKGTAPQTGGYFITEKCKLIIKKISL